MRDVCQQEEAIETRTIRPALPDAPPVELPPLPTEFPPLPDIKLPVIQQVRSFHGPVQMHRGADCLNTVLDTLRWSCAHFWMEQMLRLQLSTEQRVRLRL